MIRPDYADKAWLQRVYTRPGWPYVALLLALWLLVLVYVHTSGGAS